MFEFNNFFFFLILIFLLKFKIILVVFMNKHTNLKFPLSIYSINFYIIKYMVIMFKFFKYFCTICIQLKIFNFFNFFFFCKYRLKTYESVK